MIRKFKRLERPAIAWSEIRRCDAALRLIAVDLRAVGATKAANAVARSRKSVQGAATHAKRCAARR